MRVVRMKKNDEVAFGKYGESKESENKEADEMD